MSTNYTPRRQTQSPNGDEDAQEIDSNPFEEFEVIARCISQATEIIAALDKDLAKDLPLEERHYVAETKAQLVGQRKLLLQDWNEQLNEMFPGSN